MNNITIAKDLYDALGREDEAHRGVWHARCIWDWQEMRGQLETEMRR